MKIGKVKCETKKNFEKLFGNEDILARERERRKLIKVQKHMTKRKSLNDNSFLKNVPFPDSFILYFRLFNTVDRKYNYRCPDSNHGSLVLEATALLTEPQPLPLNDNSFLG